MPGYTTPIARAYMLADPKNQLTTSAAGDGLAIQLPGKAPDPIASVVVLELRRAGL